MTNSRGNPAHAVKANQVQFLTPYKPAKPFGVRLPCWYRLLYSRLLELVKERLKPAAIERIMTEQK